MPFTAHEMLFLSSESVHCSRMSMAILHYALSGDSASDLRLLITGLSPSQTGFVSLFLIPQFLFPHMHTTDHPNGSQALE